MTSFIKYIGVVKLCYKYLHQCVIISWIYLDLHKSIFYNSIDTYNLIKVIHCFTGKFFNMIIINCIIGIIQMK